MSSSPGPAQLSHSIDDDADPPPPSAATEPSTAEHQDNDHHEEALPRSAPAEPRRDRLVAAAKSWAISVAAVLVGLLLWYWATKNNFEWYIRFSNVPSPIKVGQAFWAHLREGTFYLHIAVSMRRILTPMGSRPASASRSG
jgi:hypothetical protein